MRKSDFVFTIGYKGKYAIVDGISARKYGSMDCFSLLENGLLKPSFCSALYDYSAGKLEIETYLSKLCEKTGLNLTLDQCKLMFGVFSIPEIKNCIFI